MSALTASDVRRIAALARLDLDEREVDLFTRQLAAILEYAEQLQAIDTAAAGEHPAPETDTALSRDTAVPSLPRDEVLSGAPGADPAAGFFTVPRVLGP